MKALVSNVAVNQGPWKEGGMRTDLSYLRLDAGKERIGVHWKIR